MGNTLENEEISEFERTALVFFKLGSNAGLNNTEYDIVNKYLNNLKSISNTDVDIFNKISVVDYFIKKYNYGDKSNFIGTESIRFSISHELIKRNVNLYKDQLKRLNNDSLYLIINMYNLENLYIIHQEATSSVNDILAAKPEFVVELYPNKQQPECLNKNHSLELKSLPLPEEYNSSNFNFMYCKLCKKYFVKRKTFGKYKEIFDSLNFDIIDKVDKSENEVISNNSVVNTSKETIDSRLIKRTSSSKPIIVVYTNFSASSENCISKHHSIINKPLYTNQKNGFYKVTNSFFCTHCNIYYLQSDFYNAYKNRYGFQYKVIIGKDYPKSKSEKIEIKPKIEKETDKPIIKEINLGDFLVRSSLMKCVNKNHQLSRIKASVSILTSKRGMIEETFDASYCTECNKAYILESTYNRLKNLGHICCKVVEYEDLAQNYSTFSSWQKKSILAMYGYNVNKQQALTMAKRHKILDILIQNKVMSSYEIISHLEMLIRTRKNMKNMADAREKWEDDIDYVQHYNKVDDSVKVKSIYAKRKI